MQSRHPGNGVSFGRLAVLFIIAACVLPAVVFAQRPTFRKPVPEGVIEVTNLGIYSVVELRDGSLLADNGRVSKDGGRTWSAPRVLVPGAEVARSGTIGGGILRLKSGALALTFVNRIWISRDEGTTWSAPVEAFPKMVGGPYFTGDEMIQLSSGRLIFPGYADYAGEHPDLKYGQAQAKGRWRGKPYAVEGHGHLPEIYVTLFAYSDDEGRKWNMVTGAYGGDEPNALMGWFDEMGIPDGYGGVSGVGEPALAETKDGRILLFARPTVNRVVYSYGSDGGKTWSSVLPSVLANSLSPARLKRISKTGDLMVIWNQVSREEVQRGYRRGRLSAAISKDNGASWENFKTLELSEGLEDRVQIPPEYPIRLARARDDVGELPEGWAYFHYANMSFVGDKVFISYLRGSPLLGIAEQNLDKQENVLRIYPLDWFYK
jgi:hypothetical protein